MRPLSIGPALLVVGLVLMAPASASAVTIDEVVSLARAGVPDQMILAMIERDKTIFSIDADRLVALRAAGVSEPVLLAMLRSGRQPAPAVPAAEMAEPILPPPPDLVIVGHGPDVPDTGALHEPPVVAFVPVFVPVPVGGRFERGHPGRRAFQLPGAGGVRGPGLLLSPFHVGPELPPSPFHVGPVLPPFGTVPPSHPQD